VEYRIQPSTLPSSVLRCSFPRLILASGIDPTRHPKALCSPDLPSASYLGKAGNGHVETQGDLLVELDRRGLPAYRCRTMAPMGTLGDMKPPWPRACPDDRRRLATIPTTMPRYLCVGTFLRSLEQHRCMRPRTVSQQHRYRWANRQFQGRFWYAQWLGRLFGYIWGRHFLMLE